MYFTLCHPTILRRIWKLKMKRTSKNLDRDTAIRCFESFNNITHFTVSMNLKNISKNEKKTVI